MPPYFGRYGWIGALVLPEFEPDWDELAALIEQAWGMDAGARAIQAFEQRKRSLR